MAIMLKKNTLTPKINLSLRKNKLKKSKLKKVVILMTMLLSMDVFQVQEYMTLALKVLFMINKKVKKLTILIKKLSLIKCVKGK
jgi:cytochrome c oxidase subunit IV